MAKGGGGGGNPAAFTGGGPIIPPPPPATSNYGPTPSYPSFLGGLSGDQMATPDSVATALANAPPPPPPVFQPPAQPQQAAAPDLRGMMAALMAQGKRPIGPTGRAGGEMLLRGGGIAGRGSR